MVNALAIKLGFLVFVVLWSALFWSVFTTNEPAEPASNIPPPLPVQPHDTTSTSSEILSPLSDGIPEILITPNVHTNSVVSTVEPPSLEEISRNMTLYLQTLHTALKATAGPKVRFTDE